MSMEETFKQLLSFQIASALECAGEPNSYGAVESAQKLIAFGMQWRISSDARLLKIAEQIENERGTALTDRERFYHSVEEISLLMVDII